MPTFKVRQYRDACVTYEATVEAESADAAFNLAKTKDQQWKRVGESEYDHADAAVYDATGTTELRESAELFH